jgi:hypothetical protein
MLLFCRAILPLALCASSLCGSLANAASSRLFFSCNKENDLFVAIEGARKSRYETPAAAVRAAPAQSAVLLLADEYPVRTVALDPRSVELARKKQLRLFIEFPSNLPGVETAPAWHATWERLVVSSDRFSPALPRLRILAAHDCHVVPVSSVSNPDVVLARVAGYDKAVYGLPEREVFPILFEVPETRWVIGTTKLSGFATARYAPTEDWKQLWQRILTLLVPGYDGRLVSKPVVRPAFAANSKLPPSFQRQAFDAAANWFSHAHLLVHPSEKESLYESLAAGGETAGAPNLKSPEGDGSLGILEGYASAILSDGTQPRRLPLRADCNAESAMVLALDASLNRDQRSAMVAGNLLNFVFFNSGMCRGARDDPQHPAYGLIGWGDVAPAWLVANYGDDNARTILATALVASALQTDRYNERLMRALLANLRTTGKLGFRGDRIDLPALAAKGWKTYYDADTINYSPHFESYLWACYLWAYRQTHFDEFLNRARTGISMTMKAYPEKWRWQNNLERAHMLLSLAWLVRIEDTTEHRQWLDRIATDLLKDQSPSGAIYERVSTNQAGHYRIPQRNEDYGTSETPLLQENGDPVSDQLYTAGFALLGLHEAVGATGDAKLKHAEDKLAEFLCRIQTRSDKFSWLNGTWFRAFDDRRWEAWGSSADMGWGAWSIEAGWGQAWTAAILALREKQTTVWEMISSSKIEEHFGRLKKEMLP